MATAANHVLSYHKACIVCLPPIRLFHSSYVRTHAVANGAQIRALCELPKGMRLPLVPFYARAVATLGQVFPDVPAGELPSLGWLV
jgi:hypothetical protein